MSKGPDKQFDVDAALDTAMHLFWVKGYAATGIAEIQERMGIGRKSLYDTFGNKRQLFMKALQRYSDVAVTVVFSELGGEGTPLENIRRFLHMHLVCSISLGSKGCLLGVAMAQCPPDDAEMAEILRSYMRGIEEALYKVLVRAQEAGELDAGTNIRDLARLFMATLQGLALLARIETDPNVLKSIVDASLSVLERT